jgi:hypothetical protein
VDDHAVGGDARRVEVERQAEILDRVQEHGRGIAAAEHGRRDAVHLHPRMGRDGVEFARDGCGGAAGEPRIDDVGDAGARHSGQRPGDQ